MPATPHTGIHPRPPGAITGVAVLMACAIPSTAAGQLSLVSPAVEERSIGPGASYSGSIVVENLGREPQEIVVYQTDYRFLADGRSFYDPPGTGERSNAPWTRVTPARLVVQPGRQEAIAYTVTVPPGVPSPSGTYWSIIMVEGVPSRAIDSRQGSGAPEVQVGISTRVRYAVQIATHLVAPGKTDAAFGDPEILGIPTGDRALFFTLTNSGERAYRPAIRLELYDEATGSPAGVFRQQRGLLYPGTALRQEFDLTGVPRGSYKALVVVDTGRDDVFGAQYTLRL